MEPAPSQRSNSSLIGIAGVHFVVSEFSRRGLVALPTIKNTAAYDIVVVNQSGTKHANVQVKASSKRVSFFPMPAPERIRAGKNDIYVFVRWIESKERYEGFLLTGAEAKRNVEKNLERQRTRIQAGSRTSEFPCLHLGLKGEEAISEPWAKAWRTWSL